METQNQFNMVDKVVAVIEYRDGSIIDVVRNKFNLFDGAPVDIMQMLMPERRAHTQITIT